MRLFAFQLLLQMDLVLCSKEKMSKEKDSDYTVTEAKVVGKGDLLLTNVNCTHELWLCMLL